jgi:hypothetical protein
MAECYCGCGRKLGALASGRKSANKVGRLVREAFMAVGQEVVPRVEASDELSNGPFGERVRATLAEGLRADEACRDVVHEQREFAAVDWGAIRAWVRDAQGMVSFIRLSPEQQRRIAESG